MAQLSLTLLGGFEVSLAGQPLTAFEYDKVRALLAYLAVEAVHPHRREMLAGLLWPERPERNARQNLSQTLFALRRVIGDRQTHPSFLIITPQTLQFNPSSDFSVDVTTLTTLVADCKVHNHHQLDACDLCSEKLQHATALYRGDFLAGFSLPDSSIFEEWSLLNRERLHRLTVEALHHLADYYQRRNDFEEALQYAWRQTELEPWQENAQRQLMRLLTFSGQREAALAQYETCHRLLDDELGIEPAAETTRLYEQIQNGTLSRGAEGQGSRGEFSITPVAPPVFPSPAPLPLRAPALFVARERELAQLDEFLDLALAGWGRVAFVTGGAGRGKTMLIQEFARLAQERQSELIVTGGNGNAYIGLGDPWLPFREILGQLTGDVEAKLAAGAISQESAVRLWNLLPLTVRALLDAGPDLVGTLLPGAALVERARASLPQADGADWLTRLESLISQKNIEPGPQPQQQSDLFKQYAQVLSVLAGRQPLLLLLDDLQWADLASINLLFDLGRQLDGSRILIVGAYRPDEVALGREGERHPLEKVLSEFKRTFGDVWLDLTEAGEGAGGRVFVDVLLDTEPNILGETFRQTLFEHTRGHPLFTVELLRTMQERGDLGQDSEGCWVEGLALNWETLPARVEGVIEERIGRLEPELRELLSVASAEGENFTAEVVAQVQEINERQLLRLLSQELEKRHHLVRERRAVSVGQQHLSRYRFAHILVQRYLYNDLSAGERRLLHREIAQTLEALYEGHLDEVTTELAYHYDQAHVWDLAAVWRVKTGQRALGLYAPDQALYHFERAQALLPQSNLSARLQLALYEGLGEVYRLTGRVEDALSSYRHMLRTARKSADKKREAQALYSIGSTIFWRGDYETSLTSLREAEQIGREANPRVAVESLAIMGLDLYFKGEMKAAIPYFERSLALSRTIDHRRTFAWVPARLGLCYGWIGEMVHAFKNFEEAVTTARELDDKENICINLSDQAECHRLVFQVKKALACDEESLSIAEEIDVPLYMLGPLAGLGLDYLYLGQAEKGLDFLKRAKLVATSTDIPHYKIVVWNILAEFWLGTGDLSKARQTVEELSQLIEGKAGDLNSILAQYLHGEVLLQLDEYQTACRLLTQASILAKTADSSPHLLWRIHDALGRLYLKLGEDQVATVHFQTAADSIQFIATNFATDQEGRAIFLKAQPVRSILERQVG